MFLTCSFVLLTIFPSYRVSFICWKINCTLFFIAIYSITSIDEIASIIQNHTKMLLKIVGNKQSADSPTSPQEPIRRITTTWPEDDNSPFYDPTAIDMNPMARIVLKRQRIYEKNCERTTTSGPIEGDTDPPITRSEYYFYLPIIICQLYFSSYSIIHITYLQASCPNLDFYTNWYIFPQI